MFEGVKRSYVLLILYIMKTIELVGTDPAFELLQESAQRQGVIVARELNGLLQGDLKPLEFGEKVYKIFMSDARAEINIQNRDKSSVTFLINRCPFYEAFLEVGVDCGIFLGDLCGNLILPSIESTLKQFDDRLCIERVVSKESAEDICIERVYLEEG